MGATEGSPLMFSGLLYFSMKSERKPCIAAKDFSFTDFSSGNAVNLS
jgi:hypothetical protein